MRPLTETLYSHMFNHHIPKNRLKNSSNDSPSEDKNFAVQAVTTKILSSEDWPLVANAVASLERKTFGAAALDYSDFEYVMRLEGTLMVVQQLSEELVGYVLGIVHEEHVDDRKYSKEQGDIYILTTVIDEPYRGVGLLAKLMTTFEDQARTMGYTTLARHSAIPNGYAEKIEKHYKDRIVSTYQHDSPEDGIQQFFRIRL